MYRTHNCGELRAQHIGEKVSVAGWVQTTRNKGNIIWIDLRDRYGLIQIVGETGVVTDQVLEELKGLGREFVVQIEGEVIERYDKNPKMVTGDI